MDFDDLPTAAKEAIGARCMDVLTRVQRITTGTTSRTQDDVSPSAMSIDKLKALVYADSINRVGRRMRHCREPERAVTHVTDAAPIPTLSVEQREAEQQRADAYGAECRKRWRK